MLLITEMFFFHGDIELQHVRSDENLILWFSFRLLLKSRPYCSVEDRLPVAITNKNIICLSFLELENRVFLDLVLLSCTTVATSNSSFCPSLRSSYTATLSSTRFWIFSTQWNSIGRRNRRWKAALEPLVFRTKQGAWRKRIQLMKAFRFPSTRTTNSVRLILGSQYSLCEN